MGSPEVQGFLSLPKSYVCKGRQLTPRLFNFVLITCAPFGVVQPHEKPPVLLHQLDTPLYPVIHITLVEFFLWHTERHSWQYGETGSFGCPQVRHRPFLRRSSLRLATCAFRSPRQTPHRMNPPPLSSSVSGSPQAVQSPSDTSLPTVEFL
jgi:hypothetical protein